MRFYQPVTFDTARKLASTVLLGCGAVPAGAAVLALRDRALKMMEKTGACFVMELQREDICVGSGEWRTLRKDAPICEVLFQDVGQFLVDRAERAIMGIAQLSDLADECRRSSLSFGPDPETLTRFRTLHGRAPDITELRGMSRAR